MKSAIFYHSLKPGEGRQALLAADGTLLGFIRGEAVEGDLSDALDAASPQPDESVMNTHEIPSA